jgi:predicted nucleotidyltransferase
MNEAGITPSPSFFSPNAILGLEYLRQLKHPGVSPDLRSLMIERESSEYASLDITQRFPSAAALRDKLLHHEDITSLLPSSAQPLWREAVNRGLAPVFPASFSPALHYALSFRTWDSLCEIVEINEDLAHRIEKASAEYASWDTLLHSLSGKTYPTARLRRILLNIVLNITQEGRAATDFAVSPPYLRVLGYRREKEFLLKDLVRHATLPVITSLSHLPPLSSAAARALQDEIRFTDLYCAALPSPAVRGRGYEYRAPLLVV